MYRRGVILGLLSCISCAVGAASFDCSKVLSAIETLVCNSPEISRLDDELAVHYSEALKDSERAESIQHSQREWLRQRNKCRNLDCLRQAYGARITAFSHAASAMGGLTSRRAGRHLDGYEAETERLEMVRSIILQQKNPRPSVGNGTSDQRLNSAGSSCAAILQQLVTGKFSPIEPVQIRSREDTPDLDRGDPPTRQADELRGFPQEITKKLRFCASDEAKEKFQGVEAQFFFGFDSVSGSPPYRVYRLAKDIDPYRGAHLLVWANFSAKDGHGSPYVWIDLDACKPVFGVQASSFDLFAQTLPPPRAQAIASHEGKFIYVEAEKGMAFSIQRLDSGSIGPGTVDRLGTYCRWETFSEPTNGR